MIASVPFCCASHSSAGSSEISRLIFLAGGGSGSGDRLLKLSGVTKQLRRARPAACSTAHAGDLALLCWPPRACLRTHLCESKSTSRAVGEPCREVCESSVGEREEREAARCGQSAVLVLWSRP